ncbi:hypothetical protein [Pseudothauera lacus]|uniref:MSHA biogenesis protein MshP n=1 Tax=Pseudothauera lacus TaxID=2136175 RepID=A0A2T4IGI1_9RHOO|nr:hypothetical protein [Pseudothauera lacus]PTD96816.1 hypothetical protein C8261_08390 [Pseudothauera lacus]
MKQQRGFSIIAVVFIMVVLSGLGAVIIQLGATQHLGTLMAQEGRQAWYATRAGVEWGRHRAASGLPCSGTLSFAGFDVDVSCNGSSVTEGGEQLNVIRVTSVATATSASPAGAATREATMTLWISP